MVLTLAGVVAILWLTATGRLGLYVHPRYFVFTAVAAVAAGVLAIGAFALLPHTEADDDHDHDGEGPRTRAGRLWFGIGAVVLTAATFVSMLLLPPSTLDTASVQSNEISDTAGSLPDEQTTELVGSDSTSFTVKEWAALLRQGVDEEYTAQNPADVSGFVIADDADPDNVFFVARHAITCCTVDAQPIGVPVYQPDWAESLTDGEWVRVAGRFEPNQSATSLEPLAIVPTAVEPIDEPADPYVY
ncbi:putative repeat protein (TIGR03943 family) [Diaminobutyricimonas aerilata]|uniref:Putative repeat protein (TIGR03943 family) n=1 Tax=Diaminobutyricimonas aerilata TaxID=1162967 RepID=A0A2M9CNK2_9MICO|nr:putative repeat protein (TIGR03943 family) [Diaminobutyricimonas aerilata]